MSGHDNAQRRPSSKRKCNICVSKSWRRSGISKCIKAWPRSLGTIDGEELQNLVLFQRSPNPAEGFRHARNLGGEDAKQIDFICIRMLQLLQSVRLHATRHDLRPANQLVSSSSRIPSSNFTTPCLGTRLRVRSPIQAAMHISRALKPRSGSDVCVGYIDCSAALRTTEGSNSQAVQALRSTCGEENPANASVARCQALQQ